MLNGVYIDLMVVGHANTHTHTHTHRHTHTHTHTRTCTHSHDCTHPRCLHPNNVCVCKSPKTICNGWIFVMDDKKIPNVINLFSRISLPHQSKYCTSKYYSTYDCINTTEWLLWHKIVLLSSRYRECNTPPLDCYPRNLVCRP